MRENQRKMFDSVYLNSQFISSEIGERDLQLQKHDDQRI
jgi:hypothetical protein